MRVRLIIIAISTISIILVSSIIMTRPLAFCDPSDEPFIKLLRGVDIEGAHIVSEGAYFRFWIFNNNTYWSVNVTIDGSTLYIPPKSSVDYNVVAPNISVPYERVTYEFTLVQSWNEEPVITTNYTVLVLSSRYAQISDFISISSLLVPMLIILGVIVIALIAFAIIKRRRVHEKT